jgi:hypothetical protein
LQYDVLNLRQLAMPGRRHEFPPDARRQTSWNLLQMEYSERGLIGYAKADDHSQMGEGRTA